MPAGGGDSGAQRSFEHLAGDARVADDEHLGGRRIADRDERAAERECKLGGEELARNSAHPVGTEQLRPWGHRRGWLHDGRPNAH
jgi:hypothetical protein